MLITYLLLEMCSEFITLIFRQIYQKNIIFLVLENLILFFFNFHMLHFTNQYAIELLCIGT